MDPNEEHLAVVPLAAGGEERFGLLAVRLLGLLEALRSALPTHSGGGRVLPRAAGTYLLTEGHVPIYVGQTRNLRRRIADHGGVNSRENQASLAFNIAREEAAKDEFIRLDVSRKSLSEDPRFRELFRLARERVSSMTIRFVEVDDPELRTVFEVYAAVALGTERNSFDTH